MAFKLGKSSGLGGTRRGSAFGTKPLKQELGPPMPTFPMKAKTMMSPKKANAAMSGKAMPSGKTKTKTSTRSDSKKQFGKTGGKKVF